MTGGEKAATKWGLTVDSDLFSTLEKNGISRCHENQFVCGMYKELELVYGVEFWDLFMLTERDEGYVKGCGEPAYAVSFKLRNWLVLVDPICWWAIGGRAIFYWLF